MKCLTYKFSQKLNTHHNRSSKMCICLLASALLQLPNTRTTNQHIPQMSSGFSHLETLLLGSPLDEQIFVEQTSCLVPDSSISPVHGLHACSMPHLDDVGKRRVLPNAGLSCKDEQQKGDEKDKLSSSCISLNHFSARCQTPQMFQSFSMFYFHKRCQTSFK